MADGLCLWLSGKNSVVEYDVVTGRRSTLVWFWGDELCVREKEARSRYDLSWRECGSFRCGGEDLDVDSTGGWRVIGGR
jgi:hypothetical protein